MATDRSRTWLGAGVLGLLSLADGGGRAAAGQITGALDDSPTAALAGRPDLAIPYPASASTRGGPIDVDLETIFNAPAAWQAETDCDRGPMPIPMHAEEPGRCLPDGLAGSMLSMPRVASPTITAPVVTTSLLAISSIELSTFGGPRAVVGSPLAAGDGEGPGEEINPMGDPDAKPSLRSRINPLVRAVIFALIAFTIGSRWERHGRPAR